MKLLFVDDEVKILEGLQRLLRRYRSEWELHFANSGAEALERMQAEPFDVIVSDVRMPGIDGVDLLTEVQARYPSTIRIILSGHAGEGAALRAVGPAHQYLSKPCDPDALRGLIERALAVRDTLTNQSLKRLVARMTALPSVPSLYREIVAELRTDEPSLQRVADIVAQDVAMSAKVLQLVNSGFFGLPNPISNTGQAVMHLGTDTIRALALSTGVFSQFQTENVGGLAIETLWSHSTLTAAFAKAIATEEGAARDVQDAAYQAGFLHEIGNLVLATNSPEEYAAVVASCTGDEQRRAAKEKESFGATHAEIGGYLLAIWGLPDLVVEAVTFHHTPDLSPAGSFTPLIAVHVADALARELSLADGASPGDGAGAELDHEHLATAGFADRVEAWLTVCRRVFEEV